MDNIIWTIAELYEWAKENNCLNYTVLTSYEGILINIYRAEVEDCINHKDEIVYL